MTNTKSTNLPRLALRLGLAMAAITAHADEVTVTPYRPTVSNPAQLSAPGYFEIETGIARSRFDDGSKQSNLPYLLKYAVTEDFGFLLGGDARIAQTGANGERLSGQGDTLLLLKHRWALQEETALGLEWGFKAPTARTGLGSGKTDWIANGIVSTEWSGNTVDLNLGLARLGAWSPGESRYQMNWAATLSHPIDARWGIAAEVSGISRHGMPPANQILIAASYVVSPRLVLDTGVSRGISQAAADQTLFAGLSLLLGN